MAARLGEEFVVGDGDADGAAETGRGHALAEGGEMVGVGIAGESWGWGWGWGGHGGDEDGRWSDEVVGGSDVRDV